MDNFKTKNILNTKNQKKTSTLFPWTLLIICITFIITIIITALVIWKSFEKTIDAPSQLITQSLNKLSSLFTEKNKTTARIAAFLKESNAAKFQFKKRNMLLLFQMIRWRDSDTSLELNDVRPGIIKPSSKNILLGQYTIAEATGEFEITFLIDMKNQDEWLYSWNNKQKKLIITTPAFKEPFITCNTPALTSNLDIFVKTDCATFDEDTTIKMLTEKIPLLKTTAAFKQLPYIREDARIALEKFFHNMLSRMTNTDKHTFNVEIKFQDDDKITTQKTKSINIEY
jgi:hypothetical protein